LLLLNSDTIVHGDVFARSIEYLDANPSVGMMGCKVLNTDGSTQMTCSRYPSFLNLLLQTLGANRMSFFPWLQRYQMLDWDRNDERAVEVISGCYLMIRRPALQEIGGLDDTFFLYGEETDWCRRCAQAGWQLMFAPVGTITHLGSGSSHQLNDKRDLLLTEGTVRLHRKHGGTLSAAALWLLLLTFNASRTAYWSLRSALIGCPASRFRANHFRRIVRNFRGAWPAPGGQRT
jgi:GT2 family glycosyltransferase